MKKTYFNPANISQNHLPKIVSKRIFGSMRDGSFISAAYRSDGKDDAEDEEDEKKQLLKKIEERVSKSLEGYATADEIKELREASNQLKDLNVEELRSLMDKKEGVMALMARQGIEIKRLEAKIKNPANENKSLSIRAQIEKWQSDNKDAIQKALNGETGVTLPKLSLRTVASPMTVATVNSGTSPYIGSTEIEAGINPILRYSRTFWDYLVKGRTSSATYGWVNATNEQGAAAFIAPGVAKPGISFELVSDVSTAKKIAVKAKTTTELLQDIEGMKSFTEQELFELLMDEVNSVLMSSAGSSTVPTGIQALSTTYTLTSIKTANPNFMDCLRAVVAQQRSGKLKGDVTIFINPIDSANMDLSKANNAGVYMLPPFMTSDGKNISGAMIVEDNNIPVGYFQCAMLRYYKILIYKDYEVSWGWENDDFTKNLMTAIGEMRLHQVFNTKYTGAFIYDSFTNVKAAIEEI